jgi:hypothetical protein
MTSYSNATGEKEPQSQNGVNIKVTVVFSDKKDWRIGDRAIFYANKNYYKPCTITLTGHPLKLGIILKEGGEEFMVARDAIKEVIAVSGYDYEKGVQKKCTYPVNIELIQLLKLFEYQEVVLRQNTIYPIHSGPI